MKGISYFIDHLNQVTTYQDPRGVNTGRKRKRKKKYLPKYEYGFYGKVQQFVARLHQYRYDEGPPLVVQVGRETIVEDSYDFLHGLDVYTLTRRLFVKFEGEAGLDYGGMSREWFLALSKHFLDEKYSMFMKRNAYTYVIHPGVMENQDLALEYFNFIGQLIGLSIYHCCIFPLPFPDAFYHV